MIMVPGTMVLLMTTDMEIVATGIVAIMIQGVAPVIGGEIRKQRESLNKSEAFPL